MSGGTTYTDGVTRKGPEEPRAGGILREGRRSAPHQVTSYRRPWKRFELPRVVQLQTHLGDFSYEVSRSETRFNATFWVNSEVLGEVSSKWSGLNTSHEQSVEIVRVRWYGRQWYCHAR
jgi:hypothetical protein